MEIHSLMDRDKDFAEAEKRRSLLDISHWFRYHAWTHEPRPGILKKYGLGLVDTLLLFMSIQIRQ